MNLVAETKRLRVTRDSTLSCYRSPMEGDPCLLD
jgi:hypothetical protein